MKELNPKNIALIALVACCIMQVGAQLFALSVMASTIVEAPPRSFALLDGEYGYNSTAFWNTVPMITFVLFIIALVTNWKNQRRRLIILALILFITAGLVAGIFLEPLYANLIKGGYSDHVDPSLKIEAKRWYFYDWMVWVLGLFAGLILLVALMRPSTVKVTKSGEVST